MKISVVINTLNESENVERCIKSVKKLSDEIIVVDMESSDDTVSLAKKAGAKVFSHKPMHYVEPARNFAISKATGDWIFIIDADEEAPSTLCEKLKQVAREDSISFVRIPRKNIIFGHFMQHARWWPDYNIRFFKKGAVVWDDAIHSIPITTGEGINLPAHQQFAIIHHHYTSVEQFVARANRYSSIQAAELHKKGKHATYVDFIARPSGEFLSRYFAGEGYKDGVHGLALSLLQGVSEFLVYLKLWQIDGFKEQHITLPQISSEIVKTQKETNYWKAHAKLQEGGGVNERVRRRLRI